MANELVVPQGFAPLPAIFNQQPAEELGAGITAGFAVVGYKGKVWSIKHSGNEYPLMRNDPTDPGPRGSIEVVIVRASPFISKIFYAQGYVEGSNQPPDCFSNNGTVPDASVTQKQSLACATCPQNAWGSKITEQGKQAKACQDSKRLVVVPAGDLNNELFGGPMLLRVPAATLKDLKAFGDQMQQYGYPYYSFKTRISFDAKDAYPHFVFSAIEVLNEQEAEIIMALRDDFRTQRIMEAQETQLPPQGAVAPVQAPAAPVPASPFQNPPQGTAAAPQQAYQPQGTAAPQQPMVQPGSPVQPQTMQPQTMQPAQPVKAQPARKAPAKKAAPAAAQPAAAPNMAGFGGETVQSPAPQTTAAPQPQYAQAPQTTAAPQPQYAPAPQTTAAPQQAQPNPDAAPVEGAGKFNAMLDQLFAGGQ